MKYKHLKLIIIAAIITCVQSRAEACSISFDEVEIMGGFNSPRMVNVTELWDPKGDFNFTEEMQQQFLTSNTLTNQRRLEIRNKNIDDQFIYDLCNNPTFSRLINIDLSGNKYITPKSLKYISESNIIGSIRDLPQISGRYGCAASQVYITIDGTGITKSDMKPYLDKPRHGFIVQYFNPYNHDIASYPTVNNAIKWLQLS